MLNARMAQAFGDHYLDVRQVLIDHYNPSDPRDRVDVANDIPPSSLRADEVHPSDAGYYVIVIADMIRNRRW